MGRSRDVPTLRHVPVGARIDVPLAFHPPKETRLAFFGIPNLYYGNRSICWEMLKRMLPQGRQLVSAYFKSICSWYWPWLGLLLYAGTRCDVVKP